MQTRSIDKILEIHVEEFEKWEKRPYKNNFFENNSLAFNIAVIQIGEGNTTTSKA